MEGKVVKMSKIDYKKLIHRLVKDSIEDDVLSLASQLAYSLLFAFFPFLIFLMTLIGFSEIRSKDVLDIFMKIMPYQAYELTKNIVVEVVDTKNANLLSISLLASIWSSVSGFNAVIKGLNKSYKESERRSFIKVQLISLIFTLGLILVIFSVVFLMIFASVNEQILSRFLGHPEVSSFVWDVTKYTILIFSMIFIFSALYRYTPVEKHKWRDVIWGAVFTTFGWLISSLGFSYYINNFGNYSKIYGSIGGVIILMLWLFIGSLIVIIGGELNSVILEKNVYK